MSVPAKKKDEQGGAFEVYKKSMSERGLKWTRQREIIGEVFFEARGHLKVDDLLERARAIDPRISQSTVYRTVKLLKECGLAEQLHFDDGQARYEPSLEDSKHHDHLVCTACGQIVEFVHRRIEELQQAVAEEHGFEVRHHRMELYGVCAECRSCAVTPC